MTAPGLGAWRRMEKGPPAAGGPKVARSEERVSAPFWYLQLNTGARATRVHPCPAALTILDAADPDPDLEPTTTAIGFYGEVASGGLDECEPIGDEEPGLGWTASTKQAGFGWAGGLEDREQEHDGREPNGDDEPWLGWTHGGALGGLDDRKDDGNDRQPDSKF